MADGVENVAPEGQSTQQSGGSGEQKGHWLGDLIKDHPTLERFKEPQALAKSYLEAEKMVSSRIPVPSNDSSQEEWDKFYGRFRPKEYKEYSLSMPGVSDLDEAKLANWKQTFYDAGLSQKQVDKVMHRFTSDLVEAERFDNTATLEQQTKTQVELKQEWGANYEANKGMILSMLQELGGDDLVGKLGPRLEDDTHISKYLYETARILRTSGIGKSEGMGNFGLMTVEEANKEKHAILYDKSHPLYQSYHSHMSAAERQPAIDRLLELNTVIAKNQKMSGVH